MLNIDYIIDNDKEVIEKLKAKGFDIDIDEIKIYSHDRKTIIKAKEDLAFQKNQISDKFKSTKNDQDKKKLRDDSQKIEKLISENKEKLESVELQLKNILLQLPNIPDRSVPVGDQSENQILKSWGTPIDNNIDHSDFFMKSLLIDSEAGVNLAKSRFTVMRGDLVKLQRALISFMLDFHLHNGYTEYYLPYLVNSDSLIGTGQLPKFKDDLFSIVDEDLYLIPTGEVPLTGLYKNKIINLNDLPIKMTSHTPCFRSEAGSYGKDTKGIIRQHQFEKVEIVQIVEPEKAEESLEDILQSAESILESLNLPYRRVLLASGDTGFSASKTVDLEVWLPGQKSYREISSCSIFTDFQSRRLNIKYKDKDNKKCFPFTLNGSALAIGRTLIALIENHTRDNVLHIPQDLQSFYGADIIKL
tara:strand:- start:79 stop:1326 length:1248 start_codon:yes stop_codon:yes gene_type:complete